MELGQTGVALGEHLEQLRTDLNLSRDAVCKRMPDGFLPQYLYRYEREGRIPSIDTLGHLATALETDITDLLAHVGPGKLGLAEYISLGTYQRVGELVEAVRESGAEIKVGGDMQVEGDMQMNKTTGDGSSIEATLDGTHVTQDEVDKKGDE